MASSRVKAARPTFRPRVSVIAATVAERGVPRSSAISPRTEPSANDGNRLRCLLAERNPGAAGCQKQEMLGDVTAPEQNRPSGHRERYQEPRQALQVRACGSGENVAACEVSDGRIQVT
jgi:hypothetical protein